MAVNIKWSKRAVQQLDEAIIYIERNSPVNAEKVKKELLLKIDALSVNPEIHTPDNYKFKNDGSFRAFELHNYRVAYRYTKDEVRIIRIRHTKMNPLNY